MIRAIELEAAPDIPGLRVRHFAGSADYPGMHAVNQAAELADGTEYMTSLEQFRNAYEHLLNCDPYRDVTIVEVDGRMVAYSRVFWSELNEGGRAYTCFGFVEPGWRRRGIATALLPRNEALLRTIAAEHHVAPKWLESESAETNVGNVALLERAGYTAVRWDYDMVRPTLDEIPDVPLPEGMEVRPVTRDQYRSIWDAMSEAFRDHWGQHDESEEAWKRFRDEPANADPSLWRVAWDGDQVAGLVLTTIPTEANEHFGRRRGYVESVAVRRPWRRRGLARALLADGLRAMRDAGLTSANLGVDTENPMGALRLYESLAFAPDKRYASYRKPLTGDDR
jgi:ribosomal protein S18 acetylase RimI-like enzyme